jgi:hypothetical protein
MTAYGESPTLMILSLRIIDSYLSCTACQRSSKHTDKTVSNDKLIVHPAQSAPLVWRKIVSHLPRWLILAQPNNMIQLSIFYVSLLRKVRVTCIAVLAKNYVDHGSLTGLLVIRTWAFWKKSKKLLIGLLTYSMVRLPQDWSKVLGL